MHNEEPPGLRHTRESGYPANWAQNSLDSRVRGNDESRRGACSGMPTIVMLCRRAQAHGHFVVKLKFLSARQIDEVIVTVNRIEELRR